MSIDEVVNFFEQIISSAELSLNSLTFDHMIDLISSAGIDINDIPSDQIKIVFSSFGIDTSSIPFASSGGGAELSSEKASFESSQRGSTHYHDVSFTGAGSCWWCHGSGVVWSGGKNTVCPKCGGSGIGAT